MSSVVESDEGADPLSRPASAPDAAPIALSSNAQGRCVIVTSAVAPGQVLFAVSGSVVAAAGQHTVQVGPHSHLATSEGDWRFINHSCAPSVKVLVETVSTADAGPSRPFLRIVARAPLQPGQEVTYNYLTTEWEMSVPFECGCGAPSCFGRIEGARQLRDDQIAELLADLAPHIKDLLRSSGRSVP